MFVRNDIVAASAEPAPGPGAPATQPEGAAADGGTSSKPDAAKNPERVGADCRVTWSIRVRPGVTAEFEEHLVNTLQAMAPDWSFSMKPTEDVRTEYLRNNYLTPLAIMGMVAGFLLLMVALGLSGVLWQNVTQRIRELGLRRAKGADRARIKRQIFMEIALMTGIALAAGRDSAGAGAGARLARPGASRNLCRQPGALWRHAVPADVVLRLVPEPARHAHSAGRSATLRVIHGLPRPYRHRTDPDRGR